MIATPGPVLQPGNSAWICVDFANTVEWRGGSHPRDRLPDYLHYVRWAERTDILSEPLAASLTTLAAEQPTLAIEAFGRGMALREAIYRLFYALANGLPRLASDFDLLNTACNEAASHKQLTDLGTHVAWRWQWGEQDVSARLDVPAWQIAESAAKLLTSEEARRLKSCPGQDCAWLFIDTSRNGSRRWCEMQICGNRAKVRRHRRKARV